MTPRRALLTAAILALAVLPVASIAAGLIGGLSGGSPGPSGISPDGSEINTLTSINGSVVNKYGVWTFGQAMNAPTGAHPPGPFGTFNYVKLNGRVINRITEFGIGGRTGASQIVVNYGGEVFFLTSENDRIWYQYVNYIPNASVADSACPPCVVDPALVVHAAGPNALPPFTPSPDGTTISSASGCLTSVDGVWCAPGGTSWQPTLNGIPVEFLGSAHFNNITVACNGQLFGLSDDNRRYTFLSFDANESWAASSSALPACPIAINVTVTPNPALVSGSIPAPQLTASTPIGTVIATFVVTMSDGSSYTATPGLDTSGVTYLGLGATPGTIVTTAVPTTGTQVTVQPVPGRQPAGAVTIGVNVN